MITHGCQLYHNFGLTLEIYESYRDYHDMMALTEGIISHLVFSLHGSYNMKYGDGVLYFTHPWKRLSMEDAVKEFAGIDVRSESLESLAARATGMNIVGWEEAHSWREFMILFFEALVEDDTANTHL